jgi:hypothetical protein
MSTTIRSTTGTAPISFDLIGPNQVLISLEDGSQQIYRLADLVAALGNTQPAPAAAWSSGYWHGTAHKGPLTDAIVEARNPYNT